MSQPHPPVDPSEPAHLFFTNVDDPRQNLTVIGWTYAHISQTGVDKPIFYRFITTQMTPDETRTMVYRNEGTPVAQLDWSAHVYLGMMTMSGQQHPMSWFVMRSPLPHTRMFESASNRQQYEWRKCLDLVDAYDLYATGTESQLASFRREWRPTPVGDAHGVMQYIFDDDQLLQESLVALCLNRWLELQQLAQQH